MSIFEKAMRQLNEARRVPQARPAPQPRNSTYGEPANRTASPRRCPFAEG
jgi:hypothetical protein